LWLKVLFAGLLWEKNTAGWLLIPLISSNEQGVSDDILSIVKEGALTRTFGDDRYFVTASSQSVL
jgi:hypothetical protein